jgi:predicted metalloprotease with PDZ domain
MLRIKYIFSFAILYLLSAYALLAQQKDTICFNLSLQNPASHLAHVTMKCPVGPNAEVVIFKMPQWTPGYYQIMNYAEHVNHFEAKDKEGKVLTWNQTSSNTWKVNTGGSNLIISYDVLADSPFVATSFMDTTHAYLTPAATFLYIDKQVQTPVKLTIQNYAGWSRIATGLDSIAGKTYTYTAPDFDVLYDCPILAGNLEELPSFAVHGIPHRFIGYRLGSFDKVAFMSDMKHIVETATSIIGDIPYKHYTFLGIGPGNGGIEHLTSSANSFDGNELHTEQDRKRMLSFLAHEYFHNYNVKRIRPVELGPFDYDNGSKTRQLWVSEGWTVYYEYMILKRAGIITDYDLYNDFRGNMLTYETHTGKQYQSLSVASAATWNDGPFGNDPEKTISYYDKGPVIALLLDFTIRHYTRNKKSLDDVIRTLYYNYYKQQHRGFTETELKTTCEQTAGKQLPEIFDYVYTTKEVNYTKYLSYGGLSLDTANHSFTIQPLPHPNALQKVIRESWLRK